MNQHASPIGLLTVLAHALTPGMVLDEHTVDGMLAIISQVKAAIQNDNAPSKSKL